MNQSLLPPATREPPARSLPPDRRGDAGQRDGGYQAAGAATADALATFPLREFGKGDTVYRAGDAADTVFRLERGLVKLAIDAFTGRERVIAVAGPGDLIGALAPGQMRFRENAEGLSVSVVARVIPRAEAEDHAHALHHAAGQQLLRLTDVLEESDLPVPARLARTFVRLGDRFGHAGERGLVRLTLPITHETLAGMIGAARETTTAVLGDMRNQGVVNGTRGRYQFQRDALMDFAMRSSIG